MACNHTQNKFWFLKIRDLLFGYLVMHDKTRMHSEQEKKEIPPLTICLYHFFFFLRYSEM